MARDRTTPGDPVGLRRDVEAVVIPDGTKVALERGTVVQLIQALGGHYTVQVVGGPKFRIDGRDGDAIGEDVIEPAGHGEVEQSVDALTAASRKALRGVHDPEIPVDIIELGLVHELRLAPRDAGGFAATVRMGLTAPGCGMGDVLVEDVKTALLAIPGIAEVDAKVVLFPVWNPDMMSDAAKLKLGML